MNEVILLKQGEMALKGLNRHMFEKQLADTLKHRLKTHGTFAVSVAQSTFYIVPKSADCNMDKAFDIAKKTFGIARVSRAASCAKDMDEIYKLAVSYPKEALEKAATFKVEAKRSDKAFNQNSMQIMANVGGAILDAYPHLKVDVKNPERTIYVEVRDDFAYIHAGKVPGAGGLPIGTAGKALLLLSGGIDSPVAGYRMARRGIQLSAIHFFSYPYTTQRAQDKVIKLAEIMSEHTSRFPLHIVPFTEIQEAIRDNCKEDYFTLIMRRFMVRIAEEVARKNGAAALITGESLGQVASQTLQAMVTTAAATTMPILQPLIGMDKEEIVTIARQIDTLETSNLPYEDCCTVFTPRHPQTRPVLSKVEEVESVLPLQELVQKAVEGVTTQWIG